MKAYLGPWIVLLLGMAACADGDCSDQSCGAYEGANSRKLTACYSSGSGSVDDKFWLEDQAGNTFFTCSRPADNNDACGVELLQAKAAYCKSTGSGSGSGSGGVPPDAGAGSGSATSATGDESPAVVP